MYLVILFFVSFVPFVVQKQRDLNAYQTVTVQVIGYSLPKHTKNTK